LCTFRTLDVFTEMCVKPGAVSARLRAMFRPGVEGNAVRYACVLVLAACNSVTNGPATDPTTSVDETVFRCNVQPVLVRQCSYNACHGNAGSPFRVYSPGKLRASPPANIDDAIAVLTDAEQHANFTSAAGFLFDVSVDDDWLLRKPLPAALGGYEHKGGAIWTGTSDPQYVAVHDWLAGTGVCK